VVPSANVVVVNEDGKILLIRRTDNGNVALPGGGMDLGESITQAAIREVKEETGLDVKITGLVGIYTNPHHLIEYTSDGEVRQEFSVVFTAEPTGGTPTTTAEASKVVWSDPADVADMQMHPSMRQRIEHYRQGLAAPYLG
jgi:8-oxo-dGTP pyrophosphatase MutT (NUDIX family)